MSRSGDPKRIAPSRHALEYLQVRGYYSTAYTGIVQPDRIFAVTDYFRRHWVPLLKPGPAWLVVALRQHCYWNGQRDWCIAGRDALAGECGVAVRTVDNYLDLPAVAWFVTGRHARYVDRPDGARHRDWTAYSLRLDEPLTPAHQAALAAVAARLAPACQAADPAVRAVELAARLLDLDPAELVTPSSPDRPASGEADRAFADHPRSFAQIIGEAAGLDAPPAGEAERQALERAADALYRRIVRPDRMAIATQYFRRAWVPLLGAARAWLVLHLRARCYLNAQTLEVRDTCTVAGLAELAAALGVSLSTVKVCLSEPPAAEFFRQQATRRPRSGVQMLFRVEMIDPLIPADRARYEAALAGEKPPALGTVPSGADRIDQQPDFAVSPADQQPDLAVSPAGQEPDFAPSLPHQRSDFAPGPEHRPESAPSLAGQQPESAGIDAPTKSRDLQDSTLLISTSDLENTSTPQVLVRDGAPNNPLAGAVGPLATVLAGLHVQEPSRSRLLQQAPSIAAVLAWTLEAFARDRIVDKTAFVVAMLHAGYPPPADLVKLAGLPVAVWRDLARAVREARRAGRVEISPDLAAPFQALYTCLGHLAPDDWPIRLEAANDKQQAASSPYRVQGDKWQETSGEQQRRSPEPGAPVVPWAEPARDGVRDGSSSRDSEERDARGRAGADWPEAARLAGGEGDLHAAQVAWATVLDSLQWQIDRAAFDAWLKRSRVVRAAVDCWTVAVADPRAVDWLHHRLRPAIERAVRWTVGRDVTVEFEAQAGQAPGGTL